MPSGHTPHAGPISVLVGENTRMHSQLLAEALSHDRGLRVVDAVSTGADFLEAAAHRQPEVVVISAGLDEDSLRGLKTLREFHRKHPEIPSVVLLDSSRRELVLEAFRCGARGIFSKNESLENLRKCVRSVHQGQVWASSREVRFVLEALCAAPAIHAVDARGLELLSAREREVVLSLAEGLTNREIGVKMRLSPHTVKNYLLRVFEKLGVSSRMELLRMTLSYPQTKEADTQGGPVQMSAPAPSLEWCRRAAEEGVPYAQLMLAELLKDGRPGTRDLNAAYFWYCVGERSVPSTLTQIRAEKERLAGLLTPAQIEDAHARAERWTAVQGARRTRLERVSGQSGNPTKLAREPKAAFGD